MSTLSEATVDRPLVSGIITAYNTESFLSDAIESVLEQTYPSMECVVVDDGSTDGSAAVVERFAGSVRLVRTSNRGVSSARNTGASHASGTHVAFLDGDDVWLPRKIEMQMDVLRADPSVGMVYTGLHLVDEDLHYRGRVDPPAAAVALRNTLLLERPVMSLTYLLPKEIFEKVGGFEERLSTSADCDFSCRIAAQYRVAPVMKPLLLYRNHSGQMHSDPVRTERDMELVFERLFESDVLPDDLRRLKKRAYANLYVSLAGAYLRQGNRSAMLRYLSKALRMRPDRVADALRRLTTPAGGMTRAQ